MRAFATPSAAALAAEAPGALPAAQTPDSAAALEGRVVRMKDGRQGTVVAHGVGGAYAVDVGCGVLVPILSDNPGG